ncbi:MAG: TerB family tellurite resistance protein [Beijerinckiaceae bacterium]|nr:TerB family tellurite resistance protein [Beijerinckiaceae bacterium]
MLQALKALIQDVAGTPRGEIGAEDYQVAAAALLVRAGHIDGDSDAPERAKLAELLTRRFNLAASDVTALIEQAEEEDREAVDLYRFTSLIKRRLDEPARIHLIQMMWDMAYADGTVHEFEENLIWRVAELIGVSSRDRIHMRQRASRDAGETS